MINNERENDGIVYPSIVFEIQGEMYSINSKYVDTILQQPKFERVAKTARYMTGMFTYRKSIIYMLDLRIFFDMPSLADECERFEKMIDDRKNDHIAWVNELTRCAKEKQPFNLAKDPHKCTFGKWYDNFKTDNVTIEAHLKKIDEPHRLLHEAAAEVERCEKNCDSCTRDECLDDILTRVKNKYQPILLNLLDETKELFNQNIYNEMVLVLSDTKVGIVVDRILSVEELETIDGNEEMGKFYQNSFVSNIQRSNSVDGLISELDIKKLLEAAQTAEEEKMEKTS